MENPKKMQQKNQKNPKENNSYLLDSMDNKLKETALFLSSKKYIDLKITNREDIEEGTKKMIEESIKDKFHSLDELFSELRKKGKDLGVLNYKLMIIPLKMKVFLATFEKKDAENLINRFEEIQKELNTIKKN